jgi:RNA polymerase sigma-70 factor (ECF subfamily)
MRCVPRILAALNARMGRPLNEHDLADLAQDTAVLAWRKIETFGDQGTLETWAYGIARLEFMNAKRRHGREGRRHERFEAAAHADARDAGPEQLHDEIEAMLMRIAPEEAQLVRLKHLAGLTFEEIGRRLGIPGNTAKTRYYRGLRSLQGLFGGQLAEGPG